MVRNGSFIQNDDGEDDPFGMDGGFDFKPDMRTETSDNGGSSSVPAAVKATEGLTVEDVKRAVVGSVGDVTTIASRLGVDRVAMRRYINAHPDVKEAIEDEILSAREQVMKQTFDDAISGSQPARADFFRMTGGMFDKKEDKTGETQQLVIQFSQKPTTFKALDATTGETHYVNAEDLQPVVDADYSDGDEGDEDDEDDVDDSFDDDEGESNR